MTMPYSRYPSFIVSSLLMLSTIALYSCKGKLGKPGYRLPQEQMRKILLDMNTAEAYSLQVKDSLHKGGTKNIDSLAVFYQEIFRHYNITEAQFKASLDWYKNNPDELDSLYTMMMPVVTKLQSANPATPAASSPGINIRR
jgi:Domain of unknown function (DUF4296)